MDNIEALLTRLDEQRDAYLESHKLMRELLTTSAASPQAPSMSPVSISPVSVDKIELRRRKGSTNSGLDTLLTSTASKGTGETSDTSDDEEEFYVETPLNPEKYDDDGLRQHLRSYKWTEAGLKVLGSVVSDSKTLSQPVLFPTQKGPVPDRSHLSHHQVFDVGSDGALLAVEIPDSERTLSQALVIWHTIREINSSSKARKAVGRISILREPSPILFGAIHYTMHKHFDVDELFKYLVEPETSSASLLRRAYHSDERRRRTFVFNFEYFTLRGDDCKPQTWQLENGEEENTKSHHISITRCSSVVALYLGGNAVKKLKNPSRQAKGTYGFVYDPFAPWHVLSLQCYPDWRSTVDTHDSTKHYVNGVEAFMVTILTEFKDAHVRFEAIYHRISRLVTPPLDFMFNAAVRNQLLFEDRYFTFTRRYFWAAQTLGIINDSIRGMIDAYEDNFTDEVWSGTHKTVWLLAEQESPRNLYFKRKMASLRSKLELEVKRLRSLVQEIEDRRNQIKGLREELFVGTSIQESRKSYENSEITVQQGHNIKILTLVSIFFLPLTFVTSVFGMTNMPTVPEYWPFATVLVCVCLPFFLLIGSLNTTRGMRFWQHKFGLVVKTVPYVFGRMKNMRRSKRTVSSSPENEEDNDDDSLGPMSPTKHESPMRARAMRPSSLERGIEMAQRKRTVTYSTEVSRDIP